MPEITKSDLKAAYDKGYREGYDNGLEDAFDLYAFRD